MNGMNRTPPIEVVVLGMHRSGTSMIAGVLQKLGVSMGEDFPGKQISNPLGHFEDGDFLTLNNRILESCGGSWSEPPSLQKVLSQKEIFSEEIQHLVQERRQKNQQRFWGWKDPRTCLTIQLFTPFLTAPSFIWCERKKDEIAQSLFQRNQIPFENGLKLTETYQNRISDFVSSNPHLPVLKVSYRDFVENPLDNIISLNEFLGLRLDAVQLEQAVRFVMPRNEIEKAKKALQWKYWFSLPLRVSRKMIKYIQDHFVTR
jgi:hypothetical protein